MSLQLPPFTTLLAELYIPVRNDFQRAPHRGITGLGKKTLAGLAQKWKTWAQSGKQRTVTTHGIAGKKAHIQRLGLDNGTGEGRLGLKVGQGSGELQTNKRAGDIIRLRERGKKS